MSTSADGTNVLPASGQLRDHPLPKLLLALHQQSFDGVLALSSARQEKRFTFERGAPVMAESNLASEALGAQLVDKGVIERADYERVCQHVQQKKCREGVALLALQLIGPKELFTALKDQLRRRMVDCFGWPDGSFRIEAGEPRGEDAQAFRCDPLALAQEGLETHWSIERMLGDLTPRLARFAAPRARFAKVLRRLTLDAAQAELLAQLDGQRALGVALGPLLGLPRAIAAVWIVDALGCLDYQDTPIAIRGAAATFASEIEIDVGGVAAASEARDAAPKPAKRAAAAGTGSGTVPGKEKPSDDSTALRAEIEKLRASLGELDHYRLLGVGRDARAGVIKKAYLRAAKQFHPDTLVKLGLSDLRDDASEVFARIAEAFEVLGDAERRNDYDAMLRGELTGRDAARLAQAEASYRKGEILLRMGDFVGALEYLRPAVDQWPDESVYRSALGWALFKQAKSDLPGARVHLTEAVRLGPEDATAHMRLSMVLRALGQTAEADKLVALAKRLNPTSAG